MIPDQKIKHYLWRETPLYTDDAEAPGWRFCPELLPALADARAALFGGEALLRPAPHTTIPEYDTPRTM